MTVATMQPETSVSPSLQVLFLQLFNMALQNISNSAPVPGLEEECVSSRAELTAVRMTMEELFNGKLDSIFESKFLEQANKLQEVSQNSNTALTKIFKEEFKKLDNQTAAEYQTFSNCDGIRNEKEELNKSLVEERQLRVQQDKEYHLYRKAVKSLSIGTLGKANKLLTAAKAGDTALVKVLLDVGVNVNVIDSDRFTPLHWAARNGYPATVQVLVDAWAEIEAKTKAGDTPLGWAANEGNLDTCRILLAAGANVKEKQFKDQTPLHIAAKWGHPEVCQLFLNFGAKIDALNNDKQTALHRAALYDHVDVVRLLLARGANRNLKDSSGKTPLDIAREGGFTDVVSALSTV